MDHETAISSGEPVEKTAFRFARDGYRWDGVGAMQYKQDGSAPFKDISRQVLFDDPALQCQLRYFEMQAGGYSTLERHEHAHAVMILRGRGCCLVGREVRELAPRDLVSIPAWTWHQFRANAGEAFGFLCMVNHERDRPVLPPRRIWLSYAGTIGFEPFSAGDGHASRRDGCALVRIPTPERQMAAGRYPRG